MSRQMADIREVGPDSPHALYLHELLQAEYVGMYGEPDPNPEGGLEVCVPPNGGVLVGFSPSEMVSKPVTLGAWARFDQDTAVLKRVYTHFEHRRRGWSRTLMGAIEDSARGQGYRRLILETGTVQTHAITMYVHLGYIAVEPFGFYADQPTSVFLGKDL